MTFPLKIGGFLKSKTSDAILITMTPTALFTAGISLTFASGTLTIDWKDGSTPENFVSGFELTHQYVSAGTYIAEITGDLENITKFIADNSKIVSIGGFKSGILTDFDISNNLYVGVLDLRDAFISAGFSAYNNSALTDILIASSGNGNISSLYIHNTGLSEFDLKDATIGSTVNDFYTYSCPNLMLIKFAASGNTPFKRMNMGLSDLGYSNFSVLDFGLNNLIFYINNNSMTAAEINHILVDIDAVATGGYTGRQIDASGSNAPPDGSSGGYDGLTAKSNLEGKGFTVIV